MNGAKLTAADTVTSSPTVNVLLYESLRVMAGGLIQGKWVNISAGYIEVEASGMITAEKQGFAAEMGPGTPSGALIVVNDLISCMPAGAFILSFFVIFFFSSLAFILPTYSFSISLFFRRIIV